MLFIHGLGRISISRSRAIDGDIGKGPIPCGLDFMGSHFMLGEKGFRSPGIPVGF